MKRATELGNDIVASVRVGRWDVVTSSQKAAWFVFIWSVPLLGSLLALQLTAEAIGGPPTGQSSGVGLGDPVGLDVGSHGGDGGLYLIRSHVRVAELQSLA